jgi:predicted transcriptional regulator
MSVTELRKRIINSVGAIEDEAILNEIHELIKMETEMDSVYKLTDQEKSAIEVGLKDSKAGKIVSSEEANELIAQWLKK